MTTTFKQFLRREQIKGAADLIKRDCKPLLRELNGKGLLYRGVALPEDEPFTLDDGTHYYLKTVRQDRKPLSTNAEVSAVIDDWFNDRLGFRARSNAMFVLGERHTRNGLSNYGEPCVVFPIGEIQYAWSPNIGDLYVNLPLRLKPDQRDEIYEWLDEQEYTNKNLDEVVHFQGGPRLEIMVKCHKYYAFPYKFKDELKEQLGVS